MKWEFDRHRKSRMVRHPRKGTVYAKFKFRALYVIQSCNAWFSYRSSLRKPNTYFLKS